MRPASMNSANLQRAEDETERVGWMMDDGWWLVVGREGELRWEGKPMQAPLLLSHLQSDGLLVESMGLDEIGRILNVQPTTVSTSIPTGTEPPARAPRYL